MKHILLCFVLFLFSPAPLAYAHSSGYACQQACRNVQVAAYEQRERECRADAECNKKLIAIEKKRFWFGINFAIILSLFIVGFCILFKHSM